MSEPSPVKPSRPESDPGRNIPAAEAPVDVKKLTPEEQMARYEEHLKENDRGHQPC